MLVMSPGPQGTSLGVDFGTSHTIAVVRRADGSLRPLLFDGAPLMPSAVCADADGGLLVGRDAVHAGRRHPERFEPNPKRLIDRPSTLLGDLEFPVPDLIAAVLHAVAEECRRVVGNPAQVTLTVPAEWGPARRQVVEDAAARAGLGRVRLVPEPVAAATYYAEALKHRMAVGSSIVVYDLGAGTFDASVVRRTDDGFTTVALDGRSDLGGLDIDAALIEHLGETYGDREGWKRLMNPSTIEERRHFRDFQEEIRGAKERLSRHQQSDIAIPLLDVEAHLTRTELEAIAQPHLEQTIRVTQAVIRAAGLDIAASAGVFLVGGASRMPLVATMLHRALGLAPTVLDQPEIVVAEGSVLWQAGADGSTFPIQRHFVAPVTPGANPGVPNPAPTPQSSLPAPPVTEPPAPQPVYEYRPSPPEPATGPVQSPARQTLPPQSSQYSPESERMREQARSLGRTQTPPRVTVTVTGDDTDPPEPPLTEEERQRRKRIGNRAVVAIILVNVLVIAGLAWYFGPRGEQTDGGTGPYVAPSFDPLWEDRETGALAGELLEAHTVGIGSLAAVDTDGGPMLFSAETGGLVRQWSMDSGDLDSEYMIDSGVSSLWTGSSSAGDPIVVAVDANYQPHVWNAAEGGDFVSLSWFEVGIDMEHGRVRIGVIEGEPVLTLVNGSAFQVYYLEQQYSDGPVELPEGLAWPNFFASQASQYTEIVAVGHDHQLELTDGITGNLMDPLTDPGTWSEDEGASGLGIVYDDGTPHAMLYDDEDTDSRLLHFWDLDTGEASYGPVPYERTTDEYHDEIVAAAAGPAILYIDEYGVAQIVDLESSTETPLGTGDTGPVTEVENLVLGDGREFAVTGDEYGNIQFWSL
jgi:actin-like ATPase involved in cell morphogenesis/WD40 repeat protein